MTTDLVFDEENLSSEKEAVMHLEHQPRGLSSDDEVFLANFSDKPKAKTRIAILYTSAASGGAFSGLLAFVIAKMDGIAGYEGWRWIFIIDGLATILLAFLTFFLLLDSPQLSSGWLMPDEIRFLEVRQMANSIQGTQQSGVTWGAVISVLTDWKIYLLILASWSNSVPNYALKFVMSQIIQRMGFTSAKAQLLTIPPYAVGALSAYVFSIFADHYAWRVPFIIAPQLLQVVAFSILFTKASEISDNVALCYFGACLACFGRVRNLLITDPEAQFHFGCIPFAPALFLIFL
ncbi:major facilitator superfamily domain-containing protein [Aspergillus alliaceus]|uniref:Major facilitator superfamily domain-containing protein n=1 Tax=Petromyces alliaceus TaxID=209559 RepID=A0A5N7CBP8_PETAA|nr:major facilitator superfamily domain-containing protein [Aspergillus alliaceus]